MNDPKERRFSHLLAMSKIEVILLCAFVGLLAMAALPHFSDLEILSDVARAKRDLNAIAAAMEAYRADNFGYPASLAQSPLPGSSTSTNTDSRLLTTPVAYIQSMPVDVFRSILNTSATTPVATYYRIYGVAYTPRITPPFYNRDYHAYPKTAWMTWSVGPDWVTNTGGYFPLPAIITNEALAVPRIGVDRNANWISGSSAYFGMRYDPTNGSVSWGDIYWFGGDSLTRLN